MPPPVLSRLVEALVRKMARRHPRLFKNLARLGPAVVQFKPLDLPHSFTLRLGDGPVTLQLTGKDEEAPDACIQGNLAVLLDMLEGRTDGDTLFFSRDIVVTGDTSLVVGLRNTLDREEINLLDEVLSLCGPFEKSAGMALTVLGRLEQKIREKRAA